MALRPEVLWDLETSERHEHRRDVDRGVYNDPCKLATEHVGINDPEGEWSYAALKRVELEIQRQGQ